MDLLAVGLHEGGKKWERYLGISKKRRGVWHPTSYIGIALWGQRFIAILHACNHFACGRGKG
jgi:hypothetical protein